MRAGSVWLVGASGLIGDVLVRALERHTAVVRMDALVDVSRLDTGRAPDIVIVKGTGRMLEPISRTMRERLKANALVVVLDDSDPTSFVFRVHESGMWRRSIRLTDIIEIASHGLADGVRQLGNQMIRSREMFSPGYAGHKEVV